jgi:predicted RNA-binding Zn ribbon-like protein
MNVTESAAGELRLVGGQLCLDFVNTVSGRSTASQGKRRAVKTVLILGEKLNTYTDLVCWSRHTGIIADRDAEKLIRLGTSRRVEATAILERALKLREALYRIFKSVLTQADPSRTDIGILNAELVRAGLYERLIKDGDRFRFAWGDDGNELDRMLWAVAKSAGEFLTGGDLSRLRECGGDDCGWLFEDTSRNRSRQWCYMEGCGNLSKVRRFRSRLLKSKK